MKVMRIVSVLLAVCFVNNVQSMQPIDQFSVERQFLAGQISAEGYVSYLASLSGENAYKLEVVRHAEFINPMDETPYEALLGVIRGIQEEAQRVLQAGYMETYENYVTIVRETVERVLNNFYQMTKNEEALRPGRMS